MARHARFDIDVPDNVLTVTVVDTFTHMPVSTATLRYVVMSARARPRHPVVTRVLKQDNAEGEDRAEGRFTIKEVPEREIRLEVSSPGYKKQDVDPFSMTKSEKKDLEVQLVPLSGSQGKIVSARPFEKGTIFGFSAAGLDTERPDLSPDGTFFFEQPHRPRDETMTVVSFSHPLWITSAPMVERSKPLEVRFPDTAPVREADVGIPGLPDRVATLLGVAIGGMRVPAPAFALHLGLRGLEPRVRGAGPLHVPDLAETGPIDILRGPSIGAMMAAQVVGNFVPLASKRFVPGINRIVFDGK